MADHDELLIGRSPVHTEEKPVNGRFVTREGEVFYEIRNFDSMKPFFMSLASDSDHWMFISSTGGLSAGRINPESALFPYYTDDKIQESAENTGSKSIFRVSSQGKKYLWEPFSERYEGVYNIRRNLYKNTCGNKLIFEEENIDLGLTFRYGWMNSERFGWIRKCTLINNQPSAIKTELLDGVQNILPYGVERFMQNQFSTLLDGYKKSELVSGSSLGIFRLESIPVDRAEPSEALKVTTVWACGMEDCRFLLSSFQLAKFRMGKNIVEERESKGVKGAFFLHSGFDLNAREEKTWYFAAEVNQDSVRVNDLIDYLANSGDKAADIEKSVQDGVSGLKSIVADADGIQFSADRLVASRHFSNVLFNVMRGGIFHDGYNIDTSDFSVHLKTFNRQLQEKYSSFLSQLPPQLKYEELEQAVVKQKDEDLHRLFLEYLPLTFSRRHGDPSRPWNLFSINIKDARGKRLLYYQGNWRDIFQNWEALALSYPEFIQGMIARFLNASSADGYNPYRVTRDGIDWEIPEPDNPFSNIGYWGDHQIIYLLKLLEISDRYFPDRLNTWLSKNMFAYAHIPYQIKSYSDIVRNPHDSIVFDFNANNKIQESVKITGADGRMMTDPSGKIFKVNLAEKILAPLLSKFSNFIPEAGIWMNTLRPEWNDANNALVGYGVSMVTLYYMRRYMDFAIRLISDSENHDVEFTAEMAGFLDSVHDALISNRNLLNTGFSDQQRKTLTDQLGNAGSDFRTKVYKGLSGRRTLVKQKFLIEFLKIGRDYIDQSIRVNKRPDKLFNAYNLITIGDTEFKIRQLHEMLEGQVSVLSSGKLTPLEALEVLDSLRDSKLYREDQDSYVLYPDRQLPEFIEKNIIPVADVKESPVLMQLIEKGDTGIIARDNQGRYHFNGTFRNAGYLRKALENIRDSGLMDIKDKDIQDVTAIYEKIFDHRSFTGRSGTFYKYEGLGSIYWHMVSKLLLAIGENIQTAITLGASGDIVQKLSEHYYAVRNGIGVHKSPDQYGAFPTDPYSHTPRMAGVQQPGMTGQVKEDIISRFFELGVEVRKGKISFNPVVLRISEFIMPGTTDSHDYHVPHMFFTCCKIPIVYLLDGKSGIDLKMNTGEVFQIPGYTLDKDYSHAIFSRDGKIAGITVHLIKDNLLKS